MPNHRTSIEEASQSPTRTKSFDLCSTNRIQSFSESHDATSFSLACEDDHYVKVARLSLQYHNQSHDHYEGSRGAS